MEDEEKIVKEAQANPQAFVLLYDQYVDRLYAYAQRELNGNTAVAQDVVSATFEKALKNLPQFEWRGVSFGAWLYKIARNEIRMHYRKEKWLTPLTGWFRSTNNVEQIVHARSEQDAVQAAIGQLSRRDQEVLRLSYYEELSHGEIGEILGCSRRNVAVRLHRALKRLRKQMTQQETQEVLFDVSS